MQMSPIRWSQPQNHVLSVAESARRTIINCTVETLTTCTCMWWIHDFMYLIFVMCTCEGLSKNHNCEHFNDFTWNRSSTSENWMFNYLGWPWRGRIVHDWSFSCNQTYGLPLATVGLKLIGDNCIACGSLLWSVPSSQRCHMYYPKFPELSVAALTHW